MILSAAIPVLRIFDEAKAREFYIDFMGFKVNWEHRFEPDTPLYCEIERSGTTLHLSEHYGDAAPGATVFIRIDDIAALHAELNAKKFRYARPMIVQQDWGPVMQIDDGNGNRLRFVQTT
jgi:catechol 2,3-dioxygenase-like lactoylglutathione lyase family enzyme